MSRAPSLLSENRIVELQLWSAAAYLALLPSNAWTFARSLTFGLASGLALLILAGGLSRRWARVPSPGSALAWTLFAWCAWSIASLSWSINPDYSASELKREIGWTLLAIAAFYVSAQSARAWRILQVSAVTAFAFYAALALGLALSPSGWDPSRWHSGVGPYATHLVLIAPLLLTLLAAPPIGYGARTATAATGLALLLLLLTTARLTDNRMVWIALTATFAAASGCAAWRWHSALTRTPLRWLAPLFALLLVLGVVFVDVVHERAQTDFPPQTPVAQSLVEDPRVPLWERAAQLVRERPLAGYGFGRGIVAEQLKGAAGNPPLWHAHNVFVAQALQTGLVGVMLFAALLALVCARFVRYLRHGDDALAVIGIVGVSLLFGFLFKNLTDDFLFRSNAKEFWALLAMLVGFGTRLEQRAAAIVRDVRSPAGLTARLSEIK